MRKYIVVGNFAEVTSGALCREKGWVIGVSVDDIVQIAEILEREEIAGGVTTIGRGGIVGGVLHNVIKVGIQPNSANNH